MNATPLDETSARRRRHGRRVVGVWLVALAIGVAIAVRSRYIADLSAFLPAAPTPEQAVLLEQLKSGATSRLVLVGIEGSQAPARAEASQRLADALRKSGLFASVQNGDTAAWADAGRFVFDHRYVLSPATSAERFTSAGLRTAIDDTLALLGTPAGAMIKPILFRDPTGETVRIAESLTPADAPRSEGGVWVSRTAPRAVLVATTRAGGDDLDGQAGALAAIRTAFAPLVRASPELRLEVSGAGSFAVASRERIKGEAERLAVLGAGAIVALLVVAFASLHAVAIALLPVGAGVLAGIAAVSVGFGHVHGMTLGFGTTLIGEAVDYAIYYLIQTRRSRVGRDLHRSNGEGSRDGNSGSVRGSESSRGNGEAAESLASPAPDRWIRESWPTVRLGLITSLIGFAALVFSGFPGLAQLGVFSIAGLAAAAATTRWVFPVLAPDGASGQGLRRQLGNFMHAATGALPRVRLAVVALAVGAALALVLAPTPWRGELMSLSPIDPADLALDAALRRDLGAPDAGTLVAVSGASESAALEAAERVGARLDPLVAAGALRGYDSPAKWLPSPAVQAARRAALPDAATLTARLAEATEGGPLAADRLGPFVADVQAARTQAPLDRAALEGTALAAAADALLVRGDGKGDGDGKARPWRALVNVQGPGTGVDTARLQAAIAGVPGARVVAVKAELDAIYARFLREAMWQAGAGALAVLALLGWHLRSARRLAAVALPIGAATLVVLAALTLSGTALGLLHLVGLLLVVAIGSNYALFFDHLREARADTATDADTLASLLVANLTTVVSFALLATSTIPVLQAVGIVVAPGALLCLVFSAACLGRHDEARAHGRIVSP